MKELQLDSEPCFARAVDPKEVVERLRAIERYNKGLNRVPGLAKELAQAEKELDRITTREIRQCIAEDRRRGKAGGGGEKEKAPNKPRPKGPVIWPWEGEL